jgi:pyruvate dehydrogenase E2 component (dihydrolipoamide acetyltransferase)
MPDIVMPRLSDSMEEGTIVRWLVEDGQEVKTGEEIVEIETDKATMSYEADADGALRIVAAEGDTLPIGAVIASIGGDGAAPAPAPTVADAAPAPEPAPSGAETAGGADAPATVEVPAPGATTDGGRAKASPVARRLAREHGIDLATVRGTGPGGRVTKADVEAATGGPATPPGAPTPAAMPAGAKGEVAVQELSRVQGVIARRMAESKATVPEFTLTATIDMTEAVALRARLKELAGEQQLVPSFNDMVIRACALALREHPRANGSYKDGAFELHSRVNVGVAVAAHDALIVPTVFDADHKTLGQIATETRALAAKVRDGSIAPPELSGGTFTVSNLGMYGIRQFTAIINAPQAAILAVGQLEPRPAVRDGQITVRQQMDVTLACDHRILYGADAALFLARIRDLLEQPLAMAL